MDFPKVPSVLKMSDQFFDVLIIGSGAAGMTLALNLPDNMSIGMICKDTSSEGSTYYAQGGVAAVIDEYDSIDSHINDTLDAGAGLCNQEIVRFTVERAPEAINWLVGLGVQFDTQATSDGSTEFHLTREGEKSH